MSESSRVVRLSLLGGIVGLFLRTFLNQPMEGAIVGTLVVGIGCIVYAVRSTGTRLDLNVVIGSETATQNSRLVKTETAVAFGNLIRIKRKEEVCSSNHNYTKCGFCIIEWRFLWSPRAKALIQPRNCSILSFCNSSTILLYYFHWRVVTPALIFKFFH